MVVAKGVLGKLAEKIAGEAGKAIGENVVDRAKISLGRRRNRQRTSLLACSKVTVTPPARIAVSKTIV
jgi:hypothetical protein